MVLWGTVINAAAIIAGTLLGMTLRGMNERYRETAMQGIGLALLALGLAMAITSKQFLVTTASLVLGGVIGEWLRVDLAFDRLGRGLEQVVAWFAGRLGRRRTEGPQEQGAGAIGNAFVSATLIYCVGAMAVLGALDGGLRNNHDILYTKALLDGFLSVILASTMGVGVMFSALPILMYQGSIALGASFIASLMSQHMLDAVIEQITAVGGGLIMGIGVNLLGLRQIRVANLLPSIVVAALSVPLMTWLNGWWHGM